MAENIKQKDTEANATEDNFNDELATGEGTQPAETVDSEKVATDASEDEAKENLEKNTDGLIKQLDTVQAALEEQQNRFLRLQADFDNFRRRSKQEREELVSFATEGLITKLLPILDNFDRAVNAQGDHSEMLAGVQMIYRQLMEVLNNEGLEVMTTNGCEFDPNFHQAAVMEPSDEVEDNHIITEWQKGYLVKGKVIRPAMVKVAKN